MTDRRAALIIASYDYEDPDFRRLVAPPEDAEALARILANPAIGGFEVQTFLNQSMHVVMEAIEDFFAESERDDLRLLYFTGHGMKDKTGRLHFIMKNSRRQRLVSTAISATTVNELMRDSRSHRQVLLLDCCYSGAFARGAVAKGDNEIGTQERFKGRGRVVLTASDAMQYSFEGDQVEGQPVRSIFTHVLVHGIATGEADLNGDGQITFEELSTYVYDRVRAEMPGQTPEKWNFGVQGDLVIAYNPNPVVKPAQLPSELLESVADFRHWIREGAASELGRLLLSPDKSLALAAYETLQGMVDDDSRRVSTEVNRILEAHAEKRSREEIPALLAQLVQAEGRSDWDTVIDMGEQILKLDPTHSIARAKTALSYNIRSIDLHSARDYDKAIAESNRAIELDPNNAKYYHQRAECYHEKKDYDQAISDRTCAIELEPTNGYYHQQRGVTYHWKNDYNQAMANYNRAIELEPNNALYYYSRGLIYRSKEDYDRAIADYTRAIELEPNNPKYYYARSISYHQKKDYDQAVADDTRAIELVPDKGEYFYSRGLTYKARGDRAAARRDFQRAVELGIEIARAEL
jgi:tetratricopeptide (TPR) repeat protein